MKMKISFNSISVPINIPQTSCARKFAVVGTTGILPRLTDVLKDFYGRPKNIEELGDEKNWTIG